MKSKPACSILFILIAVLLARGSTAAPTLSYQGRLTAGGANYSGFGYFKFVLRNGDNEGLWSNDGSSEPGIGEPTGFVTIEVNNGLFSVELGDDNVPGMTKEIFPPVFHEESGLYLRTWFSTDGTTFELLAPDVEIHALDFAHFHTGEMIVVDEHGDADFGDLQEAVNFVATNDDFHALLVMPGGYDLSAPLTVPDGAYVKMVGVYHGWIHIENTNGAALRPFDGEIENLSFTGSPAIDDTGVTKHYNLQMKRCEVRRYAGSPGPCVSLGEEGHVNVLECIFDTDEGGNAVVLSGDASLSAEHSQFWTRENGSALLMDIHTGGSDFESCAFDTSGDGPSLTVLDTFSRASFSQCRFGDGVAISNGTFGATFTDCEVGGLLLSGIQHSHMRFLECRFGGSQSKYPVSMMGCDNNVWFRNCFMHVRSNTTFYVEDNAGEVRVKDCEIHSDSGTALEIHATSALAPGNDVEVELLRCRVLNYSGTVTNKDAIVVYNAPGSPANDVWADVEVLWSEVSGGIRDGINCTRGSVSVMRSDVE